MNTDNKLTLSLLWLNVFLDKARETLSTSSVHPVLAYLHFPTSLPLYTALFGLGFVLFPLEAPENTLEITGKPSKKE